MAAEQPDPAPEAAALARRVVAEALDAGGRAAEVVLLQATSESFVLTLSAGHPARRLVVKLVRRASWPGVDLERTATVLGRARAAGVPVQEVLAADASGRLEGWQYLVLGHVAGHPWREVRPLLGREELAAAEGQVASAVLRLQSIRPLGFGELDRAGRTQGLGLLDALRHRARLRISDGPSLAVAEELLDKTADLFPTAAEPTLCHDDLHHDNLLFARDPSGWRLAAVLDWDKAWAGPKESDIARIAWWDGMGGPGFWSVYRAARPAAAGEDERRPVHQLLWCLEYRADTERHRADTALLCSRLGLSPPGSG